MSNSSNLKILQAQLSHILQHGKTAYIAMTFAQLLLLFTLWSVHSHTVLLLWFFLIQSIILIHFLVCRNYIERELDPKQAQQLKRFFMISTLISGTLWGSLTWLLDSSWDIHSYFILLPILGVLAGSMNLSTILPAYFNSVIPIILQSLFVLLFTEAANPILAIFFIIYYASMIQFSVEQHHMLTRSYQLQFDLEESNKKLLIKKEEAEKANIDKSRFLAAASHDLRQPLYAMELFLGGLIQAKNSQKREYLFTKLKTSLTQMQKMFSSLLDMSRFDAGIIAAIKTHFPAQNILDNIEIKFSEACKRKNINLTLRPSQAWLYSDPNLIQRVVENYVANALKYTDSGDVLVACRKRENHFRFEVWDSGRGIKQEDIRTIFDPFHQLDNPERDRKKGVGLGLAIVEQIAALLDTSILVYSKLDRGSFFSIDVTKGKVIEKKAAATETTTTDQSLFIDLRVWIIDDDEDILEGLQLLLESWGCRTQTFNDPQPLQAWMGKTAEAPQLLISDLRLRNHQSGIDVIKKVQQRYNPLLPSIIITGDTAPQQLKEVRQFGFTLLHKPITAERLQHRISILLKSTKETALRR